MFSTVTAPQWGGGGANDGMHPVSGNRQFGYGVDEGGNYIIYTKAVDRAKRNDMLEFFGFGWIGGQDMTIYDGGSDCWNSMLDGLSSYISTNGGNVVSTERNTHGQRPFWQTIHDVLRSNESITHIPCN